MPYIYYLNGLARIVGRISFFIPCRLEPTAVNGLGTAIFRWRWFSIRASRRAVRTAPVRSSAPTTVVRKYSFTGST